MCRSHLSEGKAVNNCLSVSPNDVSETKRDALSAHHADVGLAPVVLLLLMAWAMEPIKNGIG